MLKHTFSLACFLFLLTTQGFAREWVNTDKTDVTQYLIEYQEGSLFILEVFEQPANGFQDRVGRFAYPLESQKDEKLHSVLDQGGWSPVDTKSKKDNDFTVYIPSEVQDSEIWKAENAWSEYWENMYADWVRDNFNNDFFTQHNLVSDCADVAFYLRWIFARVHKLPVGARLAGSRVLITHQTMRRAWANLPTAREWYNDRRFLTALEYVLLNTYTHSLWDDTYPIKVNPEVLRPGTILLYLSGSMGHTRLVDEIDSNVRLLASNLPRVVRRLDRSTMYDGRFPSLQTGSEYGFLKMRWLHKVGTRWQLVEKENHPNYSLEQFSDQYKQEGGSHYQVVLRRLQQIENPLQSFTDLTHEISVAANARPAIVRDGFLACQTADCRPGTADYELHSTPSRDGRLKENVDKTRRLIPAVQNLDGGPEAIDAFEDLMDGQIAYDGTQTTALRSFIDSMFTDSCPYSVVTDPRKAIAPRWCR
jgi:hypothetical protein